MGPSSLSLATVWLLALVGALTPGLTLFSGIAVTPILTLIGVWALVLALKRRAWPFFPMPVLLFLASAVSWGAVTIFWSVTSSDHALASLMSVSALAVAGLLAVEMASNLDEGERRLVGRALVAGVVMATLILAIETLSGHVLTNILFPGSSWSDSIASRGTALLALLLWPTLSVLSARKAAVLFAAIVLTIAGEGKLAIVLGIFAACGVFLLVRLWPVVSIRVLRITLIVMVLAIPGAVKMSPSLEDGARLSYPTSTLHRLVIWEFTLDRIEEHPFRGWGMNASRSIPGAAEERIVNLVDRNGNHKAQNFSFLPLHPHNASLQIWLELGVPGVLLTGIFLWWLCGRIGASPRRALFMAVLVEGFVVANLSYGVWQSWWQSSFWLTAVMFAATRPVEDHVGT